MFSILQKMKKLHQTKKGTQRRLQKLMKRKLVKRMNITEERYVIEVVK